MNILHRIGTPLEGDAKEELNQYNISNLDQHAVHLQKRLNSDLMETQREVNILKDQQESTKIGEEILLSENKDYQVREIFEKEIDPEDAHILNDEQLEKLMDIFDEYCDVETRDRGASKIILKYLVRDIINTNYTGKFGKNTIEYINQMGLMNDPGILLNLLPYTDNDQLNLYLNGKITKEEFEGKDKPQAV